MVCLRSFLPSTDCVQVDLLPRLLPDLPDTRRGLERRATKQEFMLEILLLNGVVPIGIAKKCELCRGIEKDGSIDEVLLASSGFQSSNPDPDFIQVTRI
jgi:hypothetical protein